MTGRIFRTKMGGGWTFSTNHPVYYYYYYYCAHTHSLTYVCCSARHIHCRWWLRRVRVARPLFGLWETISGCFVRTHTRRQIRAGQRDILVRRAEKNNNVYNNNIIHYIPHARNIWSGHVIIIYFSALYIYIYVCTNTSARLWKKKKINKTVDDDGGVRVWVQSQWVCVRIPPGNNRGRRVTHHWTTLRIFYIA